MNREKLVLADAVRGFAASYVFLGHLILSYFPRTEKWTLLFAFGQEGVMLFFLLSGFVIMYSMETGADKSFGRYFGRRFFRIYPIFLLALALSYALVPNAMGIDRKTLVGNLLMLQDFSYGKPGVIVDTFNGNVPLWSLSYEWWFYLMFFPIYRFVPAQNQLLFVSAMSVCATVLYNLVEFQPFLFVSYFPIWWTGVEIGRSTAQKTPVPIFRIFASLGVVCLVFGLFFLLALRDGQDLRPGIHPILEFRHASAALLFVFALAVYRQFSASCLDKMILPFAILSPISYGIYVLHYPIVNSSAALSLPLGMRIPVVIFAVIAAAWFAEILYQQFILKLKSRAITAASVNCNRA